MAAAAAEGLNDTGITWGGHYPKGNAADCTARLAGADAAAAAAFAAAQDCAHGRDRTRPDPADGAAGFSYRKIDAAGRPLPADAPEWACVLDTVTGLMWEVKQPADGVPGNRGLHDADDLFTWYNPAPRRNGGAIGDWNADRAQCTGYTPGQPATYCNTGEFVARVNRAGLCGHHDWRLPSLPELASLVHFGRTRPAVDTAWFPHTRNTFYWSDSPHARLAAVAWAVNFEFGYTAAVPRDHPRPVRLVRGGRP
ncbi:MAG: hypothetical protein KatS3mg121_1205 [Gammaproteobacteria bacterium]|nr:MAG: hypothetical protein KatS3mg121_1205 [Gammaproteobacteria bacterium]